jgi:hypothetical protein
MDGWMDGTKERRRWPLRMGWKLGLNNDLLLPEFQLDNLPQRTEGRQKLEIVVEKMARYLGDIGRG